MREGRKEQGKTTNRSRSNPKVERQTALAVVNVNRVRLNLPVEIGRSAVVATPEAVPFDFERDRMWVTVIKKRVPRSIPVAQEMAILPRIVDIDVVRSYRSAQRHFLGLRIIIHTG